MMKLADLCDKSVLLIVCTVGQKTVPMFGSFAKIDLEQIRKTRT